MNITLRKANAVQNSINEAVKALDFDATVKVNEFQDAEQEISKAAAEFRTNLVRRDALIGALYEIRKSVGSANATAGIDARLADVAQLEKQIQFYTGLAGNKVRESEAVVAGRLDKIRNDKSENRRASIYGYNDTVDTTVFNREDLDGFRQRVSTAKKQKQKLQDEILELNVRTEISLSEAAEKTLRAEGLI
jgi:hypothetical protein